MRVILLTLFLSAAATAVDVPAFPGAEGFGAMSRGGRGGKTLHVSNLNDSGPGSLRAAVETLGPRTILFALSGVIALKSPLRVREPFVTIAGQTAPGDGICLRDHPLIIETHDVVVRHIRSRLGDESRQEADAISISTGSRDVILDHVSAGWSVDEALSPSGDVANITVQWSIIAEGLRRSAHSKGEHGYGSLVRATGGVSLHHNLWAHNTARNPRLGDNYGRGGEPTHDIRNNVMYNWGGVCTGMVDGRIRVNYVANSLIPGADSRRDGKPIVLTEAAGEQTRFYLEGNTLDGKAFGGVEAFNRAGATIAERPFDAPPVRTGPAAQAAEAVLAGAGATRPKRDGVDARIVEGVRRREGRIIDSQRDAGGWPPYRSVIPPKDTDGDGMPDEWETRHKLNPQDASDGARVAPSGYTNLEEYLNSLAG